MASFNDVASSSAEKPIEDPATTETRKVILKTCDNALFEVDDKVANQSLTIKSMLEDCTDMVFLLINVKGPILAKVVEFPNRDVEFEEKKRAKPDQKDNKLNKFDEEFVKEFKVYHKVLFDMILAANYLNFKELVHLCFQANTDMMKGKSPEDIRSLFLIVNDYTPEEQVEVRRNN